MRETADGIGSTSQPRSSLQFGGRVSPHKKQSFKAGITSLGDVVLRDVEDKILDHLRPKCKYGPISWHLTQHLETFRHHDLPLLPAWLRNHVNGAPVQKVWLHDDGGQANAPRPGCQRHHAVISIRLERTSWMPAIRRPNPVLVAHGF